MIKNCSKCKIEKYLNEFYKNKLSKDGHQTSCKECRAKYYLDNKCKNLIKENGEILLKKCTKCNNEFKTDQFDINLRSPTGYDYWCCTCRRNYTKQHSPTI